MSLPANVVPRLDLKASLGEGLHWDHARGELLGVDIHGCKLWCWDTHSAGHSVWELPQRVGWAIPTTEGQLLLGLQEGFALARRSDPRAFEWVCKPFAKRGTLRLNDAKADSSGAVWAGSLNNDDESSPDGCLYRLSPTGELRVVDTGYKVANGPAIRADNRLMLHTDSARRTIYAFDLDVDTGTVTGKRIWKVLDEADGYPDGMCFDAENCVWIAHWGAGCICRYSDDGTRLRRIEIPASQPTNVCFGGVGLDRLFVSTARVGLSPAELTRQPLAGTLFEILDAGTRGLPGLAYAPAQGFSPVRGAQECPKGGR